MLNVGEQVSLINETFDEKRNFSPRCTKVTDSVTSVTLNENITNLLLCVLKKINVASPFWGCYFNQDRNHDFQKMPILESPLSKNRLSLLTARK